jgi:hypothetical protein
VRGAQLPAWSTLVSLSPAYTGSVATLTLDSPAIKNAAELLGAGSSPSASRAPVQDREAEMRVANLVQSLFFQAREARRPVAVEWKRNYRVLNGRLWQPGQANDSWAPRPEVPKIWPIIASLAAWMTDQRPNLEAVPTTPPFSPYADYYAGIGQDMTALLNTTYQMNSLPSEITMLVWDCLTYGIGYVKNAWEPWLADGKGDAVFRRVDPMSIFPDPHARTVNDMGYIIQAHTLSLDDLDRAWPGARAKMGDQASPIIDADLQLPHKLDDTVSATSPRYNLAPLGTNTPRPMGKVTNSPDLAGTQSPMVTALECWVRSHKHVTKGGKTRTEEIWTCIVTCGSVVLAHDDAWDINSFGTHPFDKMTLFSTGEWYGPALVSLMASAQSSINRILAAIEANIELTGNPMLVEATRSSSRNKRITNRPGARLEADPREVAWMNPPQMHPQMAVMLLQYYAAELESISGMSALQRGFSPTGRNAQGVIDSVQDAAFVRVRATLRELEGVLRRAGTKLMGTIAEFYDEPRMATILGPDGERTALTLREKHFYDPEDGKTPLRFALLADAGSELSTSRQALAAQALSMYGLQLIDRVEALKALRWPNYSTVAQRADAAAITGQMQGPGARAAARA